MEIVASSLEHIISVVEDLFLPRLWCMLPATRTPRAARRLCFSGAGGAPLLVGSFDFVKAAAMAAVHGQHLAVDQQRAVQAARCAGFQRRR